MGAEVSRCPPIYRPGPPHLRASGPLPGAAGACSTFVIRPSSFDLHHATAALEGLRKSNIAVFLPRALLTAALHAHLRGDEAGASHALAEAQQITERGPMPLFLADVHLHRARLFRDNSELTKARTLIEKHGYWRRKEELEDAEAAAVNW